MSDRRERTITLAVTPGEPAGIGPDIVCKIALQECGARIVAVADRDLLIARSRQLGHDIPVIAWQPEGAPPRDALEVLHVPLRAPVSAGTLDPQNSSYVLETLERAVDGCMQGRFDAMVTGPVNKGVINAAGFPFTGHTEFLAERTATPRVVMMLVGAGMRVALATTHVALSAVAGQIDERSLEDTIRILVRDLGERYALAQPRIGIAGLNPHAGESGYLGREEVDIIIPVVQRLCAEGMRLSGPLPADTLFTPARLAEFDAVLAMYHDQGLPVLKYASFGRGVNVTLGLPIIRTSVDHGTALDIAGSGKADEGSLREAIDAAVAMAHNARPLTRASGAPA